MRNVWVDAARGRTEPRWHLKPHHQIVILSVAALTAFLMVAAVTVVRLGEIHADYGQVADRAVPVTEALTKAELFWQGDMAESTQLLRPMTEVQRAAAIADLTEKARLADAAWSTYQGLATGVEGEKELQAVALRAEAEQIRLITPALSGNGLAPGTAERIAQAGATQINAIETLRGRYVHSEAGVGCARDTIDRGRRDFLVMSGFDLALLLLAFGAVYASVRRRDRQVRGLELERAAEAERNDLETRLTRSLEMVHEEAAVYPRVKRAIAEVADGRAGEVLIADASHARLRQVIALGTAAEGDGCPVGSPRDCPAIARGQTQLFAHSGTLGTCPFLAATTGSVDRALPACIPLSIAGKTIGIVHVTAAPDALPDPETVARLEIIARKAGDRIAMLRAFSQSETEAHTDQLTGLLNRRSLEDEVRRITESGRPYAVAYGDLDHFKEVNDVYGHDAGDRALRMFARVLRDSVRPNDIPARYGGEEFVVVLPDCSIADAVQVLERVRENLARAQVTAASPPHTVSFGLGTSVAGAAFDDVLKIADLALAEAKAQGRDRIVVPALPAAPA